MAIEGAIETVTEEVATNLEEAARATRAINPSSVSLVLGGLIIGASLGFYLGRRWNREKIKAEEFERSEAEIAKMREAYQALTEVKLERQKLEKAKPSLEEVLEEKGYSADEEPPRPTKPPVPVDPPLPVRVVSGPHSREKSKNDGWDYREELANRSEDTPYVIHQDEFMENEHEYSHVTYTYYAGDDVLTDEDEDPLPHAAEIVGIDNLKFGHGTDDEDVVFVRNDKLGMEMEICRVPGSYEEEVMGLEREEDDSA